MKKIIFGITSLTLGGAERVLIDIVNKLCDNYDITIFTFYGKGELEKQLNDKVNLINMFDFSYLEMNKLQKTIVPIKILFKKNKIYNKYIKNKFDVEVAFLEGAITRVFSCGQVKNKIAWIHNDISKVFGNNLKSILKRKIDKKIYNKYDKLVFVTEDNKKAFEELYKINNEKQVIYNYIDKEKVINDAKKQINFKFDINNLNFVVVSRLVEQKAIDRLIKIHSKLIKENLFHNIYVIGDGPLKGSLNNKIKEENVEKTFKLLGAKENPYPYINKADYFALCSYYEGYPMVLEEAKILNKKIIITDTAAREVLKKYNNALIVQNSEDGIYNGLKEMLVKR